MVAGFDPVRDAAAVGSPTEAYPPRTPRTATGPTSTMATTAATPRAQAGGPSSAVSEHKRRATDLSVLLNASAPLSSPQSPLFTPQRPIAAAERDYFPPHHFTEPRPPPQLSTSPASVRKPVSRSSLHSLLSPTNVDPVLPFRRASGSSDRAPDSPPRPGSRSSVHDLCLPTSGGNVGSGGPVPPPVTALPAAQQYQPLPPTFAAAGANISPFAHSAFSRPGTSSPERSPVLSRPSTASSAIFLPSPQATVSPRLHNVALETPVVAAAAATARTSPLVSHARLATGALPPSPSKPIAGPSSAASSLSTAAHSAPTAPASTRNPPPPKQTVPLKRPAPSPPPADPASVAPTSNMYARTSSALPYRPTKRLTPAGSLLVKPLSRSEADLLRDPANRRGYQRLSKRAPAAVRAGIKRPPSAASLPDGPPVKRSKDVALIENHYNARPEVGKTLRQTSPIIGLKNFNNWVKSVLIHRFAHPVLANSPNSGGGRKRDTGPIRTRGGKVLDMGCGKGGDLMKWSRAPVKEYVGVDIAAVSVDQARARWLEQRSPRFDGEFAALDCYTHPLTAALPPARLAQPFDVVSMQFCMHYAFETPAKARQMLENVTRWLRPGGVFIGTIPNADLLLAQLDALPPDADPLEFGNSVYRIRFEQRNPKPVFGHRYWFFLQDAVDDVPEYVVRWDSFAGMAAEYGLRVIYKQEFHQVFQEHQEHPEYKPLMVRMNVVDSKGESQMDEDQWEAANVYLAFAFEKR